MAEPSSSFSWVEWLTNTAHIPQGDAVRYAERLVDYGADSVEGLRREVNRNENLLISGDIGMKKGHANAVKDILTPVTLPLPSTAPQTHPSHEIGGAVLCSSGQAILVPGMQGHMNVMRKISLKSVERAETSLRHEYEVYGRLRRNDVHHTLFPQIYDLDENCPIPPHLQSQQTGSSSLALVMEKGFTNFFEFVEHVKNGSSIVTELQNPLSQVFNVITAVHHSGLVWMDFKPQNVVVFVDSHASRQFKGIDFDRTVNVGTRLDASHGCTICYASPEQVRSGSFIASPAQDYWSLGVMLIWIASPPGQDMYSMMGLADDAAILSLLRDSSIVDIQLAVDGLLESFKQSRDPLKKFTAKAAEGLLKANPISRPATIDMMTQSEFLNCIRTGKTLAKLSEISNQIASVQRSLTGIVMGDHECPRLAVLIPDQSLLSNLNPFKRPYKLYFMCPVTLQLGNPYEIKITRQWVVNASPAIRVGLSVLRLVIVAANIAGSIYGIPPILPNIPDINAKLIQVSKISQSFVEIMDDADKRSVDESVLSIESIDVRRDNGTLPLQIHEKLSQLNMSQESFAAIRNLLPEDERSVSRLDMSSGLKKIVSSDGSIAWVHALAVESFRRDGMSCFRSSSSNSNPKQTLNEKKSEFVQPSSVSKPSSNMITSEASKSLIASSDSKISSPPSKSIPIESKSPQKPTESNNSAVVSSSQAPSKSVPVQADSKPVAPLVKPVDLSGSSTQVTSSEQKSSSKLSIEVKKPVEPAKEEKLSLGMRPCRNELDCRRVVVDILKQTRGVAKWNRPDDEGNQFNWSEELPLGGWNGIAPNVSPSAKRIQVDGNGMITKLFLNGLEMRGMLPDMIGNLTSLIELAVSFNQLTHIPNSIGNLTSLTIFYIGRNQLTLLPDSIGNMTSLTRLYVDNNLLTHLPDSIGNLTSLTVLYVGSNQLTHLPDWIGNLTSLTVLYVGSNQLTHLPDWIGNLTSLTELRVSNIQLTHLPDWIGNLTSLTVLDVYNNQLTHLPDSIGNLTSLTWLHVGFNQLTYLPDSIGNLTSLTVLAVSSNQLTHLPDWIGNLSTLTELSVYNNQLTHLPDSICNLSSLTTLGVYNNQLTHLPDSICNLSSLTKLYVYNNQLTHLPDSIGNLTSLTELDVPYNPITSTQAGKDEVKRRFGRAGLIIKVE